MNELQSKETFSQNNSFNNSFIVNSIIQKAKTNDNDKLLYNSVLFASYSLIIVVSLIGNLIVLKVIFGKRRARTTTNILIANLAVADLLMTIMNIPFNIARILLDNWPFGQTLCVLVPLVQSISVYCSSLTMMFIAIERYKSLIYSTHISGHCIGNCFPFGKILSIIWLTSIVLSIPNGAFNRVVVLSKWANLIRCRVEYPNPSEQWRQALTTITFLTQYLTPIFITCICYLKICWFIYQRKIVGNMTEVHRLALIRRKRRRIKMLIMVVLVFAICWLPFNIFHLLMDFYVISYSSILFFINHWFAMSSVCYNPFIYCWLNSDFRNEFKTIFKCFSNTIQRIHSQRSDRQVIRLNTIVSRFESYNDFSEENNV